MYTHIHTHNFFLFEKNKNIYERKKSGNATHEYFFIIFFSEFIVLFYILDFESVTCLDYLTDYKHVNVYANRCFICMSLLSFHLYKIKLEYNFV
jgi:hypothetical protein